MGVRTKLGSFSNLGQRLVSARNDAANTRLLRRKFHPETHPLITLLNSLAPSAGEPPR